ncbi:MAG: CBS domain-containing protein [Desulfuromonas sp.]|jgi:CBS domain-containing protein|nr:CBS domain-containing protein [Desulfuromonas sp.]
MLIAENIMTSDVISVQPQTELKELADLFQKYNFSSMPVIDDQGDLCGIITTTDLIDRDTTLHIPTVVAIFDWVLYLESEKNFEDQVRRISARTVAEICTTNVITCAADTPVTEIAELMVKHKIHLIPVVKGKKVLGVVARLDIVRAIGV